MDGKLRWTVVMTEEEKATVVGALARLGGPTADRLMRRFVEIQDGVESEREDDENERPPAAGPSVDVGDGKDASGIAFHTTERGFVVGKYLDRFGIKCSIEEGRYAGEPCLWIGFDDEHWIHLTRKVAADLILPLAQFALSGKIAPAE